MLGREQMARGSGRGLRQRAEDVGHASRHSRPQQLYAACRHASLARRSNPPLPQLAALAAHMLYGTRDKSPPGNGSKAKYTAEFRFYLFAFSRTAV
jgi:hypothetical protein